MAALTPIQIVDSHNAKRDGSSKIPITIVSTAEVEASSPTTNVPTAKKNSAEQSPEVFNTNTTNAKVQKPVPTNPAATPFTGKPGGSTQTPAAKHKPLPPGYKLIKRRKEDGTITTVLRKMTPEELEAATKVGAKPPTKAPSTGKADAGKPASPKFTDGKVPAPTKPALPVQSTTAKAPVPAASELTAASVAAGAAGAGAAAVALAESFVKLAESGNKIHATITGQPLPETASSGLTPASKSSTAPSATVNASRPPASTTVKEATPAQLSSSPQALVGIVTKSIIPTTTAPTAPQTSDMGSAIAADRAVGTPIILAVASKSNAAAQKHNMTCASAPSVPATASKAAIAAPETTAASPSPANVLVSKSVSSCPPASGSTTAPKTGTVGNAGRQAPNVPASAAPRAEPFNATKVPTSIQPGAKRTLSSQSAPANTKDCGATASPKPHSKATPSSLSSAAPNASPSTNAKSTLSQTCASAPQKVVSPAPQKAAMPAANGIAASQIPAVANAKRVESQPPPTTTSTAGTCAAGVGAVATSVPQSQPTAVSPAANSKSTVSDTATRDIAQSTPGMTQPPVSTSSVTNDMPSATRAFLSTTAGAAVNTIPAVHPNAPLAQVVSAVLGVPATTSAAAPGASVGTPAVQPVNGGTTLSPLATGPLPNIQSDFNSFVSQKHSTGQNNTQAGSNDQSSRDISNRSGNDGGEKDNNNNQGQQDASNQHQMGQDHEDQGHEHQDRRTDDDAERQTGSGEQQVNGVDHDESGLGDGAEQHATVADDGNGVPLEHGEGHEGDIPYEDGPEHDDDIPYEDGEGQEGDIPYEEHDYAAEGGNIPYEEGEGQEGDIPYEEGEGQEGDIPYEEGEGQEGDIPYEEGEGQEGDIPYEEGEGQEGDIPYEEGEGQEGDIPYEEGGHDGDIPYEGEVSEGDIPYDETEHETQEGDVQYEHGAQGNNTQYAEDESPEEHAVDEEDYNVDHYDHGDLDDAMEDDDHDDGLDNDYDDMGYDDGY